MRRLFLVVFFLPFLGWAEDLQLIDLPHSPAQNPRLLPLNLSGAIAGGKVESSDPSLSQNSLLPLIDTDRTSGVELSKNKEYSFVLTFDNVERINKMTLAGELKGATVDVKMAKMPSTPSDSLAWEKVVENRRLDSDINTVSFKPQQGHQALVTVKTDSYQGSTPPTIRDLSTFGTKDVRDFAILPKSEMKGSKSISPTKASSPLNGPVPKMKVNVAGLSSGASVVSSSFNMDPKQSDNAIDDNVATFMEIPKNDKKAAMVVDLGQNRNADKVTITHSKTKGVLKAYMVKNLPGKFKSSTLGMRRFVIIILRGELILTRKDKSTVRAKKGDMVTETDAIKTGKNSLVELKGEDSSVIRLGPDTSFNFSATDRTLNVDEGRVLVSIPEGVPDLIVNTPKNSIRASSGSSFIVESEPGQPLRVTNLPSPSESPLKITEKGSPKSGAAVLEVPVLTALTIPDGTTGSSPKTQNVTVQDLVRSEPFFEAGVFPPLPSKQENALQAALQREVSPPTNKPTSTRTSGPPGSIKELLSGGGNTTGTSGSSSSSRTGLSGNSTALNSPSSPSLNGFSMDESTCIGTMPLDQSEFSDIDIPLGMAGQYIILIFVSDGFALPSDLENYDITFKIYDVSVFGEISTENFVLAPAPPNKAAMIVASRAEGSSTSESSEERQSENTQIDVSKIGSVLTPPSDVPVDASPTL